MAGRRSEEKTRGTNSSAACSCNHRRGEQTNSSCGESSCDGDLRASGNTRRAFKELAKLAGVLNDLGVKEIVDIGAGAGFPDRLHGISVRHKGELGTRELEKELSRATFGDLSYPANCLAKSSILAAYCAHGTIPVIAKPFVHEFDGLRDGEQVLSRRTAHDATSSGLESCSISAWEWYAGHRIGAHAEIYARWLNLPAPTLEREEARP